MLKRGIFYFRNEGNLRCFSCTRKRVVFLGSPECGVDSLKVLLEASSDFNFEVVAVVTQPPILTSTGVTSKTAVQKYATKLSIPCLTPNKPSNELFLESLRNLDPHLCVTAAYGGFLPRAFLKIPKYGTYNIHPSLLPLYRGAAPIQRCLENGDTVTGVSVLETVLKMDAGPLLAQSTVQLSGNEKTPELLHSLFVDGTRMLVASLPAIFNGCAATTKQDDSQATLAPKLQSSESEILFGSSSATVLHNRCRGFADKPGIWGTFTIGEETNPLPIKLCTTVVLDPSPSVDAAASCGRDVSLIKVNKVPIFQVVCGDGSKLGIVELLPPFKRQMSAKDFANGLRKKSFRWVQ